MANLYLASDGFPPATELAAWNRDEDRCPVLKDGTLSLPAGAIGTRLAELHCPLAIELNARERFESLLADLSATFVNIAPDQVDERIRTALASLVELLRVDRGSFGQYDPVRNSYVITHSYAKPGTPPMPAMILDSELPWYAGMIRKGEPLRLAKLPEDLPSDAVAEREYCLKEGLKSHVMIPLRIEETVKGAIGFGDFQGPRDWPDGIVQRLRIVGEVFANALVRKRADEVLRDRERTIRGTRDMLRDLTAKLINAQEEERSRLAREMHDDWSQRLAMLGIELAMLQKQTAGDTTARDLFEKIRGELVDLSGDVHDLSRQLHPSILQDLGLAAAVRSEVDSFERREGVAARLHQNALPELPKEIGLCIYRVIQEALRNVAKHARARSVSVTLGSHDGNLEVEVKDDGAGFDADACRTRPGLGMSSMAERLHQIGAKLEVESEPGSGTRLFLRVPLSGDKG